MLQQCEHIADLFRAFVPDDRYRKFLRVLNTTARVKGRLIAWQDFLWMRFVSAHPDMPLEFNDIASALCICPVHLRRMVMQEVPIEYGYWHFESNEVNARENLFPFANYVVHGPDWAQPKRNATVPVCEDCRQALDQWNARRKHPFGMPSPRAMPDWSGEYFVVEDGFEIPRGLVLMGRAADRVIPWPSRGQSVALRRPDGTAGKVTVLDVDKSLARSCFSDGSAQRGILIARDGVVDIPPRGTVVCESDASPRRQTNAE